MRPTLLNGCARAATAAEARYRIDRPIAGRSARVFALDAGAAAILGRVAEEPWRDARFLECEAIGSHGVSGDVALRAADGSTSSLSEELAEADVAIVVATSDDGADAVSAIAQACEVRGVMTAGLILGRRFQVGAAVSALRPYAPVLLVTDDERDLSELLIALRA
jgi:hypothetical protein